MATLTTPGPSRTVRGTPLDRPAETVRDGARLLGTIEQDPNGDWWAKPAGAPWFVPMPRGLRMEALDFLERCARLPSGYRPRPDNRFRLVRPWDGKAEDGDG